MSKVPCGGFKLDENFLGMNENDELSLVGGGGEGKAYQQLTIGGNGEVGWGWLTLPVVFVSSGAIRCSYTYDQLKWFIETGAFDIMNCQLHITNKKMILNMVGLQEKPNWLEFSFVIPKESGSETVLGEIVTVYYRNNGDITFDAPVK